MAEDGKIVYRVIIDDTGAIRDADDAGRKIGQAFDTSAKNAGGTFEEVMTGAARRVGEAFINMAAEAARAVAGFMQDSIGVGMNFDSAMAQVAATLGYSTDELNDSASDAAKEMKDLRDFAQEMGASTVYTATQAAQALNYMALAGYDADTSMKMLPNVLNLAASGSMELARASDVVTDIQSALGLTIEETTDLVDQMAKTASTTNTSVAQLGDAMLQIGATATFMRGGSAELAQVLGLLADNGIKGAEGGTHLRNMLLSLSAPTEKGAELLEDLGMQIFDSEGKMNSFADIFQQFNDKMAGWSEQDMISAFDILFNKRDTAAALALMNTTAERWNKVGDAIDGAEGSAEKMANVQLDNLKGDITLLNSAIEGFQISVSDKLTPILREIMPQVIELVGQLSEKVSTMDLSGLADKLAEGIEKVFNVINYLIDNGDTVVGVIEGIGAAFAGWKVITAISSMTGQVESLFGWVSKLAGLMGVGGAGFMAAAGVAAVAAATVADRVGELGDVGYLGEGHSLQEYADNVQYYVDAVAKAKEELDNLALYGGDMTMAQDTFDMLSVGLLHAQEELEKMSAGGAVTETAENTEEAAQTVDSASGKMIESIDGVTEEIRSDFIPGLDEMSQAAAEETESMNTVMDSNMGILSANAAIWGEDMIISLANGIIAGHNQWLLPTLQQVAQSMADYLEHSEPDKGPLSNDSTWMPDMMASFAEGIRESSPMLYDAITGAFDLEPTISNTLGDVERNVTNNMSMVGRMPDTQINVPLYIDGREVARATAWSMSEQLAWEEI